MKTTDMQELEKIMEQHLHKYPDMETSDMVKLIYQNEFGGGHLITDAAASLAYIQEERAGLADAGGELCEDIGNHVCRVNLSALEHSFLNGILGVRVLNQLFVASANLQMGNLESFKEKLTLVLNCAVNQPEAADFLADYADRGYPVMRHSEAYRQKYSPAYRIVSNGFAAYIPLFQHVEKLLQEKENIVIGIDGKCGGGKTTLALLLQGVFDCNIIHMDDFFLPPDLRNGERLNEAGGNVHYERFYEEVILPLNRNMPFSYRVFDCCGMQYRDILREIVPKRITIVEGSYSMRPEFAKSYDWKVFMDIPEGLQRERIINRNGEEKYAAFAQKWIPMENKYFEAFQIPKNCDVIFSV